MSARARASSSSHTQPDVKVEAKPLYAFACQPPVDGNNGAPRCPDEHGTAPPDPFKKLLDGFDLGTFTKAHVEQYELDVAKWEASTIEEWEAYGLVLLERFTECINMAKDHMRKKMALYSSLKGVTEERMALLHKRGEGLEELRRDLAEQVQGIVTVSDAAESGGST